ncbi:unnamed protein product [Choristocarpus tenellus]
MPTCGDYTMRAPPRRRKEDREEPIFLRKTYEMINTCNPAYACWSARGDTFTIKDPDAFAENEIPKFFKHNKFSSFVRQLNFYGFRKVKSNVTVEETDSKWWEFKHDLFQRGKDDLLIDIKRATHYGVTAEKQEVDHLRSEVTHLRSHISDMDDKIGYLTSLVETLMVDNKPFPPAVLKKVTIESKGSTIRAKNEIAPSDALETAVIVPNLNPPLKRQRLVVAGAESQTSKYHNVDSPSPNSLGDAAAPWAGAEGLRQLGPPAAVGPLSPTTPRCGTMPKVKMELLDSPTPSYLWGSPSKSTNGTSLTSPRSPTTSFLNLDSAMSTGDSVEFPPGFADQFLAFEPVSAATLPFPPSCSDEGDGRDEAGKGDCVDVAGVGCPRSEQVLDENQECRVSRASSSSSINVGIEVGGGCEGEESSCGAPLPVCGGKVDNGHVTSASVSLARVGREGSPESAPAEAGSSPLSPRLSELHLSLDSMQPDCRSKLAEGLSALMQNPHFLSALVGKSSTPAGIAIAEGGEREGEVEGTGLWNAQGGAGGKESGDTWGETDTLMGTGGRTGGKSPVAGAAGGGNACSNIEGKLSGCATPAHSSLEKLPSSEAVFG